MDVIWNLTRICPWNCSICCVSALYANEISKERIKNIQKIKGKELSFNDKIKVLRVLAQHEFEIDFSGGDPLYYEEDFFIVKQATEWLSIDKIGVSMTGKGIITKERIDILKKVNIVEITFDCLPDWDRSCRPEGYNLSSMNLLKNLVEAGVKVRAVTILHKGTIQRCNLKSVYKWLCDNGIQEWDIIKLCPVGRTRKIDFLISCDSDYCEAVNFISNLDGSTKVVFQHTFGIMKKQRKCHAAVKSIGILPDGTVTACAWALDDRCRPLSGFYIGRLPEDDLDEILFKARNELNYSTRSENCRILEIGGYYENQNC